MKKKLLLLSCLAFASASMEAWHGGGYHGGYHRGGWGNGGAFATGALVGIGTTAAVSAAANSGNRDPYAQVDKYKADQELADMKAEAKEKERDRKEEAQQRKEDARQSRKRTASRSEDNDKEEISSQRSKRSVSMSAKERRMQELKAELAALQDDSEDQE